MWVRQSGYKVKAHFLVNIDNGAYICIEPNTPTNVNKEGTNSHGVVWRRERDGHTLFVGTYEECIEHFEKLVRYINNGARIAFSVASLELPEDTGLID